MFLRVVMWPAYSLDPDYSAFAVSWPVRAPGPSCDVRGRTKGAISILALVGLQGWLWELILGFGLSWLALLLDFQRGLPKRHRRVVLVLRSAVVNEP